MIFALQIYGNYRPSEPLQALILPPLHALLYLLLSLSTILIQICQCYLLPAVWLFTCTDCAYHPRVRVGF
ncbi:hypothetical protein K503DRAFT_813472 [Rhizopogon vinicolor AM-OR11-026]|uniref:Uncharacterized protein n=1 Tax=Rhizopogon vinicolor AM-OR11-026 TaxID=1314800 RepID=A0A1B7MFM6_9AGAM|nr:hypothetical protein K503DRAFT_813472 [Rhizopogon vinicolor AM-OR11-026]